MFRFSKEVACRLRQLRKTAQLTQSEVAIRMGSKGKSGHSFIVRLENGKIKHPALETILNYLDAVGVSWGTFFIELSILRSKQMHTEIMSQVKLPSDWKAQKKLDRDTFLYETKIKPPQNYYTKVDLDLVKQKIKERVSIYCQNLQIKEDLIPNYLNFAYEIISASKYKPIIDKYFVSGISRLYLTKIMNIANQIYQTEQKKVQKQKPIRLEKARAMAAKYLRSRVRLAPVEAEISKFLEGYNLKDNVLYNAYMNFGRVCFGKIRKFHIKNPLLLRQHLNETINAWVKSGLKPEILKEIQQKIIAHFEPKKK